jgi:hypothetical protein
MVMCSAPHPATLFRMACPITKATVALDLCDSVAKPLYGLIRSLKRKMKDEA